MGASPFAALTEGIIAGFYHAGGRASNVELPHDIVLGQEPDAPSLV